MVTKCRRCQRILTNSKGQRLSGAVWDSGLASKLKNNRENTDKVAWAWCEECYRKARQEE